MTEGVEEQLGRIGEEIAEARHVIAFTGAGISTESGLPDYRGPSGLWRNRRFEDLAHLETFKAEPAEFWDFYRHRLAALRDARPNSAHSALAALELEGHVQAVITQNVDGLHVRAGSRNVIELHGTLRRGQCLACGREWPIEEAEARLEASEDGVPRCDCGYVLKPGVTLFGEALPRGAFDRAWAEAERADLALCLGSSLQVWPAAAIPQQVLAHGGRVVIISQGETDYDDRDDVTKIEAPLGEALPAVARRTLGIDPARKN